MKIFFLRLLIVSSLALAATARGAEANSTDEQRRVETIDAARARAERLSVISINFPGGTIAQLIKAVADSDGATFNIIGEKADLSVDVPPFSIRNARPKALALALSQVLNPRGLNLVPADPSIMDTNVWVLRSSRAGEPTAFDSFQLAPYLDYQSVEDITGAIRSAWELDPAHRSASLQLKYHPPTTILLVSGTPEAIGVAHRVVDSLKRTLPPQPLAVERTPEQEQARLNAVAAEVQKRREIREKAQGQPAPKPAKE